MAENGDLGNEVSKGVGDAANGAVKTAKAAKNVAKGASVGGVAGAAVALAKEAIKDPEWFLKLFMYVVVVPTIIVISLFAYIPYTITAILDAIVVPETYEEMITRVRTSVEYELRRPRNGAYQGAIDALNDAMDYFIEDTLEGMELNDKGTVDDGHIQKRITKKTKTKQISDYYDEDNPENKRFSYTYYHLYTFNFNTFDSAITYEFNKNSTVTSDANMILARHFACIHYKDDEGLMDMIKADETYSSFESYSGKERNMYAKLAEWCQSAYQVQNDATCVEESRTTVKWRTRSQSYPSTETVLGAGEKEIHKTNFFDVDEYVTNINAELNIVIDYECDKDFLEDELTDIVKALVEQAKQKGRTLTEDEAWAEVNEVIMDIYKALCDAKGGIGDSILAVAQAELEDWTVNGWYDYKYAKYRNELADNGYTGGHEPTAKGSGQNWCARFICWCAMQCKLLGSDRNAVITYTDTVYSGSNSFYKVAKAKGLYQDGSVLPEPGWICLLAFSDENDLPSHVGIVSRVEGTKIYYISGNSGTSDYADDASFNHAQKSVVDEKSYYLGYAKIYGYFTPEYPEGTGSTGNYDPTENTAEMRERMVYYFLKNEMGLNDAACAGVMGNIKVETDTFDPTEKFYYNKTGCYYIGICQWSTDPSNGRWDKLVKYTNSLGLSEYSLTGQLNYIKHELEVDSYYKKVVNAFNVCKDTEEQATGVCETFRVWYEGGNTPEKRKNACITIYRKIKGGYYS